MLENVRVCDDLESLSHSAAELFVAHAREACQRQGRFSVALAGGNTPRRTYELLAAEPLCKEIDWSQVHIFWGDERCVPSSDDRSNAKMARRVWLDHVPLPPEQIHAIDGTGDPHRSAEKYQRELQQVFANRSPRFDLVYLGLGENGHTASLFPDTAVLDERDRWAAEVFVPEQKMYRITLTAPLLNEAEQIVFLVSGSSKAAVLRDVLEGPPRTAQLPAQLVQPQNGTLLWLVDRPAARLLSKQP